DLSRPGNGRNSLDAEEPTCACNVDSPRPVDSGATESLEALGGRQVLEPQVAAAWTREEAVAWKHAALRIYLGAAPGLGKTYAMLSEGQRRHGRGTDVVVGFWETYDRPVTNKMVEGLEVVPRKRIEYRGTRLEEMDA